jgi:hypothetical protein
MQDASEPAPFPALRLIFEYSGSEIRLISQQPVDLAVSGYELHPDVRPGHYAEIQDATGQPLSRVPVHSALSASTEVFPEDHSEPITRIDTPDRRGAFTVVVPAPAAAQRVAVIRVAAPQPGRAAIPARPTDAAPGEPTVTELASFAIEHEH